MQSDPGEGGRPPPRRGSRILFRYMTREFVVPLVCCVVGFLAIFLFNAVFDDLPDFRRRDGTWLAGRGELALYFLLLQPANVANVLPMSVLLSTCFVISRMGRHHELTAMRAAGIDMVHAALPIWLGAALLCGASFWVSEQVAPACSRRAVSIYQTRTESPERLHRQAKLVFHNPGGRRDWFFEVFQAGGLHRGVFLKQFTPSDRIDWELQAATAEYRDGRWLFHDCEVVLFDPATQLPAEDAPRRYETFEVPGLDETPERIVNHVRPAEHLSAWGIRAVLEANPDLPERIRRALRASFWFRIASSLACLVGALFGVGLSLVADRGGALRGFSYAVAVMVSYYVMGEVGLVLARAGHIPVLAGTCFPVLAFVVGGALLVRARR